MLALTRAHPEPAQPNRPTRPIILFVDRTWRDEEADRAPRDEVLWVPVGAAEPSKRGQLASHIEEALESALGRMGAAPSSVASGDDFELLVSDWLYRARLVEFRGLTLSFDSLASLGSRKGALDENDSAALRSWVRISRLRPVRLLFAASDQHLGIHEAPVSLSEWLEMTRLPELPRAPLPPAKAPVVTEAREAVAPGPHDSEKAGDDDEPVTAELRLEQAPLAPERGLDPAIIHDILSTADAALHLSHLASNAARPVTLHAEAGPRATSSASSSGSNDTAAHAPELTNARRGDVGGRQAIRPVKLDSREFDPEGLDPNSLDLAGDCPSSRPEVTSELTRKLSEDAVDFSALARERWRTWLHDIDSTRGPKPLAQIERLFTASYVPLCEATARGLTTKDASVALDTWAKSFEQSYKEAFDALRVRPKRPTMVLDVPSIALRLGRLHGARSTQLIVIDGLRYDLGLRLKRRLELLLGQKAALAESLLLWAALPTTTAVQLDLLGGGSPALRELQGSLEPDVPVARGRGARTLRRVKAGHRDLLKLDVVEATLSEPGPALVTRLDDLADEMAESVAQHFLRLPPRTLVMLFGDHGFRLPKLDDGTGRAESGGASPEEVLVPAFAWLVGDVH